MNKEFNNYNEDGPDLSEDAMDARYDEMKEAKALKQYREAERLTEVITDCYNTFVNSETGYYSGKPDKFLKHIIAVCDKSPKKEK